MKLCGIVPNAFTSSNQTNWCVWYIEGDRLYNRITKKYVGGGGGLPVKYACIRNAYTLHALNNWSLSIDISLSPSLHDLSIQKIQDLFTIRKDRKNSNEVVHITQTYYFSSTILVCTHAQHKENRFHKRFHSHKLTHTPFIYF